MKKKLVFALAMASVVTLNAGDKTMCTMNELHTAAGKGDLALIKKLLDEGADVNAVSQTTRKTALHFSMHPANMEAVQLLVESKANLEALDKDGQSVLVSAVICKNLRMQSTPDEQKEVLEKSFHDLMRYLSEQCPALLKIADIKGQTPLFYAVAALDAKSVEVLFEEDASEEDIQHLLSILEAKNRAIQQIKSTLVLTKDQRHTLERGYAAVLKRRFIGRIDTADETSTSSDDCGEQV